MMTFEDPVMTPLVKTMETAGESNENTADNVPRIEPTMDDCCDCPVPSGLVHVTDVPVVQDVVEQSLSVKKWVGVASNEPKFTPWMVASMPPVVAELLPSILVSVRQGASYVNGAMRVPTKPLTVTTWFNDLPTPRTSKQVMDVVEIQATVAQTVPPSEAVGV